MKKVPCGETSGAVHTKNHRRREGQFFPREKRQDLTGCAREWRMMSSLLPVMRALPILPIFADLIEVPVLSPSRLGKPQKRSRVRHHSEAGAVETWALAPSSLLGCKASAAPTKRPAAASLFLDKQPALLATRRTRVTACPVGQTFLSAQCPRSLAADKNVCPTVARNVCPTAERSAGRPVACRVRWARRPVAA